MTSKIIATIEYNEHWGDFTVGYYEASAKTRTPYAEDIATLEDAKAIQAVWSKIVRKARKAIAETGVQGFFGSSVRVRVTFSESRKTMTVVHKDGGKFSFKVRAA